MKLHEGIESLLALGCLAPDQIIYLDLLYRQLYRMFTFLWPFVRTFYIYTPKKAVFLASDLRSGTHQSLILLSVGLVVVNIV